MHIKLASSKISKQERKELGLSFLEEGLLDKQKQLEKTVQSFKNLKQKAPNANQKLCGVDVTAARREEVRFLDLKAATHRDLVLEELQLHGVATEATS